MFAFRNWWRVAPTVVALACAAPALSAPATTTIQDVLYRADGSRFNGTLKITWNNFQSGDSVPIPTQGITVTVVNGNLKVKLVPTTTASAGANYSVKYMSQGVYQFTETWAVPPSSSILPVSAVRISSGTTVGNGSSGGVGADTQITDIAGLSAELSSRPQKGPGFAPSRAAVVNSSGQIDSAAGNLGDCLHVDGSSGPCGSTSTSTNAVFADAEAPGGLVNGLNLVYTLNNSPSPAGSLRLYRNGLLMKQNNDYVLSGTTVTFNAAATPQSGDLLTASYRYTNSSAAGVMTFVDGESPAGVIDGSNASFTLGASPSPALSLELYRNGLLLKQSVDYSLSGGTITFFSGAIPRAGDLVTAFYRY
ncbi:MAG: hypothetical protein JSU00_29540 [Acidobacteria bacterium]|nr:hypothetical protein [Acidobacteriota bacterium]